jgi:hypothetical protein
LAKNEREKMILDNNRKELKLLKNLPKIVLDLERRKKKEEFE